MEEYTGWKNLYAASTDLQQSYDKGDKETLESSEMLWDESADSRLN